MTNPAEADPSPPTPLSVLFGQTCPGARGCRRRHGPAQRRPSDSGSGPFRPGTGQGRRVGGRLATKQLGGGADADYGAQFITARSKEFKAAVATWLADGTAREWCRGVGGGDGHPRFAARNGMPAWLLACRWSRGAIHL